ncbi:MAG: hypothetical protein K9K37_13240, partial [Desulfocapsa sp.]|nr:hypothetical protein [Desulfocapsa sp.]
HTGRDPIAPTLPGPELSPSRFLNAIPGELVDGTLIPVDLLHEDLKCTIHDLVNFLAIQLFRDRGISSHDYSIVYNVILVLNNRTI